MNSLVLLKFKHITLFTLSFLGIPESIPFDFDETLADYTRKGLRVIACAYNTLHVSFPSMDSIHRDDVEMNLIFAGFLIFQNRLKPDSAVTVEELKKANIPVVMTTGDNIYTAIHVATKCGILMEEYLTYVCDIVGNGISTKFPIRSYNFLVENDRKM